jgi:hypothetical protein
VTQRTFETTVMMIEEHIIWTQIGRVNSESNKMCIEGNSCLMGGPGSDYESKSKKRGKKRRKIRAKGNRYHLLKSHIILPAL